MNALLPFALACALAASARSDEKKFDALAIDCAALADLVTKLDKLVLENVEIVDLPIGEAVSELQKHGVKGRKASGVIHFVVRPADSPEPGLTSGGDEDDPFGDAAESQSYYPETVSLTAESISFAAAIDELCKRAGYIGSVDIPKPTAPCLTLRPAPDGRKEPAPSLIPS